jgi:hypothetical protein
MYLLPHQRGGAYGFTEINEEKIDDMQRAQQKLMIAIQNRTTNVKNELLKDRELRRVEQLKANAEIRRKSLQADQYHTTGRNNG